MFEQACPEEILCLAEVTERIGKNQMTTVGETELQLHDLSYVSHAYAIRPSLHLMMGHEPKAQVLTDPLQESCTNWSVFSLALVLH